MKNLMYLFLGMIMIISTNSCSKPAVHKPLNEQLDDLEAIIAKYEPRFDKAEFGSGKYEEILKEFNGEIHILLTEFNLSSTERDEKGNRVHTNEFRTVEKRFTEISNKLSTMLTRSMKKSEGPKKIDP